VAALKRNNIPHAGCRGRMPVGPGPPDPRLLFDQRRDRSCGSRWSLVPTTRHHRTDHLLTNATSSPDSTDSLSAHTRQTLLRCDKSKRRREWSGLTHKSSAPTCERAAARYEQQYSGRERAHAKEQLQLSYSWRRWRLGVEDGSLYRGRRGCGGTSSDIPGQSWGKLDALRRPDAQESSRLDAWVFQKALVQDEDYSLPGAGLAEVEVIETQPDH
jgi:hypothetical protein